MKKNFKHLIFSLAISSFILLASPLVCAQQFGSGSTSSQPSSGTTCDRACSSNVCSISRDTDRWSYIDQNKSSQLVQCIQNKNAESGSCIDTFPIKGGNFNLASPVGKRDGPNGNMHYGMDLGTSGQTGLKATAPADGVIKECRLVTGGGRGIFMEHEGSCGAQKYTTVFLHLAAWTDAYGKTYKSNPVGCAGRPVKKGDVVGIVGGSNYKGGKLIENGYAVHLHFEIHNTAGAYSNPGLKSSIVNPLCPDIQKLCGGCQYDISTDCGGLSPEAAQQLASYGGAAEGFGSSSGGEGKATDVDYEAKNAMAKCNLDKYMPERDTCYFCKIFLVIFNTASTIALKSYNALAGGISNLVIVGFALWLSITILRHISSMEAKDPRKMLQEILVQAFRVLLVWIILRGSFFQIMQLTLEPVFNTGMRFTQAITGVQTCEGASFMEGLRGYSGKFEANAHGGLPLSMGQSILCTIKTIQDSVAVIMAYGSQAMCLSVRDPYVFLWVIPNFPMLITGVSLWIAGLVLMLAFPWCLVDSVLNMCIAAGLAPAAIGAWAFKITSSYLKKIWDFFMNAMFNFVFLGIIIFIIKTVVDQFMERLTTLGEDVNIFSDPINGLAYWGVTFLQLFIVCFLGWVVLDEGKATAKKFAGATGASGASHGGIGRSVGSFFAQAGKRAGTVAGKASLRTGKGFIDVADRWGGTAVRRKFNTMRINKTKNKGVAIKDAQGNIIGYERTRRNLLTGFKRTTSRVQINADGTESWSREKQNYFQDWRSAAIKWTNKRRLNKLKTSGQPIVDADGNITGYTRTKRPWYRLGKQVTLTAQKDQNGEYQFSKQVTSLRMEALALASRKIAPNSKMMRAINNFATSHLQKEKRELTGSKSASILSSDHLIAVRQRRDSKGNIVEQKIKFKSNIIKKRVVNKDGTINLKMYDQIMEGTRLDKKTVQLAIALEVLQRRNISINESFAQRNVSIQNGVISFSQRNSDGSMVEFTSSLGGKDGDQMLMDIKSTTSNGSYTRIVDNGSMRKTISYQAGSQVATAKYEFADHVYKKDRSVSPIDKHGNLAPHLDRDEILHGFEQSDLQQFGQQLQNRKESYVEVDPTTAGQQHTMTSMIQATFITSNGRLNKEAYNRAISNSSPQDATNIENAVILTVAHRRLVNNDLRGTLSRIGTQDSTTFYEITRQDGSRTEFNATIGGPNSNQFLLEAKTTKADGSYTHTIDNGLLTKVITYEAQNDQAVVRYGIDNGVTHNTQAATYGFAGDELQKARNQFLNNITQTIDPSLGAVMNKTHS